MHDEDIRMIKGELVTMDRKVNDARQVPSADTLTQPSAQEVMQWDLLRLHTEGLKRETVGQIQAAINLYQIWLSRYANVPNAFAAWYEFGRLLDKVGENHRSGMAFVATLEIKPDFTDAALALGYHHEKKAQPQEAVKVWQQCILAGGNQVLLLNNIGRLCDLNYQYEQAEDALKKSWQLNSDQPDVLSTLFHLRQRLCEWPVISEEFGLKTKDYPAYFGPIASLAMFNDPVKNLASVQTFLTSKGYTAIVPAKLQKKKSIPVLKAAPAQKLRVGFLSADYRMHATSVFFGSLLEKLDRQIFEVYALDITVAKEVFSEVRERLLGLADHLLPLQTISDEQAIEQIRALDLDMLVDMSGLTAGARPAIVASRVAPVQVSYLGFIASSGMHAVDYIMTTSDLYEKKYAQGYSEKPLFLNGPYFSIHADLMHVEIPQLSKEKCGLPQNAFVYCALVNTYKITNEVFDHWLSILKKVERGILWLVGENDTFKKNITQYALQHGVAAERLIFSPRVHPVQFRSYLQHADVLLDTSPYGNGATAREAILANVPILTCPGNTMMSRLSAHLMKQLCLDDFVVTDWVAYVDFAVALGQSKTLISTYKAQMQAQRTVSQLFNPDQFALQFGKALQYAYET